MTEPPEQTPTLLADDDWAWTFLKSYTQDAIGNISAACRAAHISTHVAKRRRETDTTFKHLWDDADQAILGALLQVTLDQAINGTQRPIYQAGELVGHVQEIDWHTRRWLLERLAPEQFHLPTLVEFVGNDTPGAFTFELGEKPLELPAADVIEENDPPN